MKNKFGLIILLLAAFFTSAAFSQETKATFSFTVLDDNDIFQPDLKSSDFQVRQAKKFLPVSSIEIEANKNLEVVIMIDASASQEKTLPNEKKLAEYFIDGVLKKEKDKVAIVKFTDTVSVVQDLTNDFAKAKERIGKIEFEPPNGFLPGGIIISRTPPQKNSTVDRKGSTSIWDSIKQITQSFAAVKSDGSTRRVIILISDGVNTFGDAKLMEAINSALKNQMPIYAFGIGDDFYGGVDKKTLKKLAAQTGGVLIVPKENLKDAVPLMNKIEQSLRSIYRITFASDTAESKNKIQEIEIELINAELKKRKFQIIQSKGYFLP